MKKLLFLAALCSCIALAGPSAAADIALPAPQIQGGLPIMDAFAARHSNSKFSSKEVSLQDIANVCWAACGINRENGKRTVPTKKNEQLIALYVVLPDGVYLYDPKNNVLEQKLQGEEYIKLYKNGAPALLLHAAPADNEFSKFHIGSMYQNAALYCAAAGLNNKMKEKETDKLAGKLILPGI